MGFFDDYDDRPKRKTLTLRQRIQIWEHPEASGLPKRKICNICGQSIKSFDDMELDHVRAYSKGGKTLAMVHKTCNKIKSNGGQRAIQKMLGVPSIADRRKKELQPMLEALTIKQLKQIINNNYIKKPKGSVSEGLFDDSYLAPTKTQYVRAIIKSDIDTSKLKAVSRRMRGG
jgi:hypothetical protein